MAITGAYTNPTLNLSHNIADLGMLYLTLLQNFIFITKLTIRTSTNPQTTGIEWEINDKLKNNNNNPTLKISKFRF